MECLGADTVLELIGGQLPRERIAALAEHLDACSGCRRLVSATADAGSIDAASAATEVDLPSTSRIACDPMALPVVPRDVYLRLDEVARGGLGRIVRAQDLRTGRMVAIKEMLADTPDAAARFVREAIVTANLQHPAIVPVYEVGRWPDDQPFYAMKLVTGRPLSAVIDAAHDLDQRLALIPHVIAIADALAHAHGEGVIHRDLKPHNVLIGAHGETVVIDWGLARRIVECDPLAAPTMRGGETVIGAVLGTPAYMAPEQARGERVDERGDVYAIGAILYRALSGSTPYRAATSNELIEAVRRGPPPPLAGLAPAAPRDLVAVVERAMARDPAARYRSANELVTDLRLFATGQLVRAHRYTALQRVRRFVTRHRTAVVVAAVASALLATVGVASIRRVVDARDLAQHELAAAYVDRGRVELAAEHPDRALAFAAAAAELGATGADVRFIAARALDALPELRRRRAASAAFVPGTRDAIVASDTVLARWRPETDQTLWSAPGARDIAILGPHELAVRRAAIDIVSADDGRTLTTLPDSAAVRGGFVVDETRRWLAGVTAGGVALYDLASRTRVATVGTQLDAVVLVAPDGEHLVATRGSGLFASLVVVDRAGAQSPLCKTCWLARSAGSQFVWIGIAGDGHGQRMGVADWTGKPIREIELEPGGGIGENLVVDPERGVAVVANSDGTLLQYILPTGGYRGSRTVRDVPYAMAFERGDRVWVLGLHNSLSLFDLKHGLELGRWRIGGEGLARSDDGTTLAIANGGEVSAWRVPPPRLELVQPTADRPDLTAFTDDGALLVASGGALAERDPHGAPRTIARHAAPIESLEPIAPNAVLAASRDGEVAIWDRLTGAAVLHLSGAGPRAAASPDGRVIATGDHGGRVVLWDRGTGRPIATLGTLPRAIAAIRWTRDGACVGAIDDAGGARLWDRAGALVRDLPDVAAPTWSGPAQTVLDDVLEAVGRTAPSIDLAFSSDGRQLARACPGCAALHELATGRTLPLVHGPEPGEPVLAVAFSHDGSRVLLAYGGTLRLWDTTTGVATATIAANTRTLAARFSPDDRLVFTGGMDNRLRVWDAATGAEYTGFDLNSPIHQIAMSPDGARVAATSANSLMLWTLGPLSQPLTQLRSLAGCRTGLVVDAGRFSELAPSCAR